MVQVANNSAMVVQIIKQLPEGGRAYIQVQGQPA